MWVCHDYLEGGISLFKFNYLRICWSNSFLKSQNFWGWVWIFTRVIESTMCIIEAILS